MSNAALPKIALSGGRLFFGFHGFFQLEELETGNECKMKKKKSELAQTGNFLSDSFVSGERIVFSLFGHFRAGAIKDLLHLKSCCLRSKSRRRNLRVPFAQVESCLRTD